MLDKLGIKIDGQGIHFEAAARDRAKTANDGVAKASEMFGRVLEEAGPDDNTPGVATWGELAFLSFEQLGINTGK